MSTAANRRGLAKTGQTPREVAIEIMQENGYPAHEPEHVTDTRYPNKPTAWRVGPGVYVYDDDPDTVVSLEDVPERFIEV